MTVRTSLALALASCTLACATEVGSVGRTRESLDDYVIEKPIEQAWTDALRFLDARGYPPVGADRKRLGLPEMGGWATTASKGRETQVTGERWTMDTQADGRGKRYHLIGVVLGPTSCRIGFFAIDQEGVTSPSDRANREQGYRDSTTELAFIESIDPQAAAKMKPKGPGFF